MPISTSPEEPLPVRTVSRHLADWIGRLGSIWVEGQVTGLTRRPGVPVAFATLRDVAANVSLPVSIPAAVLTATEPPLADGQRVVVFARPDFRIDRGRLHLAVTEIRAVGLGALLARLEQLRAVLRQEGLFDPARKKPLPFLPRTVGLICGRESAARHDVEQNAQRRWPAVRIEVREVAVQGPSAVAAVTAALRELDRMPEVDVIVITRGGGSPEDLLPFSDEALCRAVAAARTPVVSAIGHESDAPLLDLVADWRASTPTDAAKRVVPDVGEEQTRIATLRRRAWRCAQQRVERDAAWLSAVRSRPALADPLREVDRRAAEVSAYADRSRRAVTATLEQGTRGLAHLRAQVAALAPAATLERGYAIVRHGEAVVRDPADVPDGTPLTIRVARGEFAATAGPGSPAR